MELTELLIHTVQFHDSYEGPDGQTHDYSLYFRNKPTREQVDEALEHWLLNVPEKEREKERAAIKEQLDAPWRIELSFQDKLSVIENPK